MKTTFCSNVLCDELRHLIETIGKSNAANTYTYVQSFDNYLTQTIFCYLWKVVNSSWIPNKNETKHQGMMTDLVLVECFLPDSPVLRTTYDENVEGTPASGLLISVSNNGIHQSEQELKLISFDSVCMECNISTGCSLKVITMFPKDQFSDVQNRML